MLSRLALGTVQFGLTYGVANRFGQVAMDEATAILDVAAAAGIDTLDTAIAYGDSERRLGELGVTRWRVVSKLPAVPSECRDIAGWVVKSVDQSLERLRINILGGMLIHHSSQLLGSRGEEIFQVLLRLKEQRLIEKLGVSIYLPQEVPAITARFPLDIFQAPFSVVDRRLEASGCLDAAYQAGIEIHTRSAFLQGLLLMHETQRPPRFARWQTLWKLWHKWLEVHSITPVQGCLGYVLSRPQISRVVVGVDSAAQLREIVAAVSMSVQEPPAELSVDDDDLLDPLRWLADLK